MPSPKSKAAEPAATPSAYRTEHQRDVVNRLKRIEGQVRGLIDMVESGRPCEDVAQQMSAARKAMEKNLLPHDGLHRHGGGDIVRVRGGNLPRGGTLHPHP